MRSNPHSRSCTLSISHLIISQLDIINIIYTWIEWIVQIQKYFKYILQQQSRAEHMSEFDRDCITYTQQGRLLQLQYANKAHQNAQTIVGVKCKDGILLGAQKLMFSKLLVDGTNPRIFNIYKHIGMVVNGKVPDGKHIMNHGRHEAHKYYKDYDVFIGGRTLANRLSLYLNAYTLYSDVRPFGSVEIFGAWTEDEGYSLFMLEPSGAYYGYSCCTAGKGRQTAKAQFEKTDFSKLTCRQALFYVAKILIQAHEESKDKKYQYEISWICQQTNHAHRIVPKELIKDAVTKAETAIEEEQMG